MKSNFLASIMVVALFWGLRFGVQAQLSTSSHNWVPQDSIALRDFDPKNIVVSPDGSKFFFITFHDDLSCDCAIYELAVFAMEDIRHAFAMQGPRPKPLSTLVRSAPHDAFPLRDAQWMPDGTSISFVGQDRQGVFQYFLYNMRSGKISELTHWKNHRVYSLYREGNVIVSTVWVTVKLPAPVYPVHAARRSELVNALFSDRGDRQLNTLISFRKETPWEVKTDRLCDVFASVVFSGDSNYGVQLRCPRELPPAWNAYDEIAGSPYSGVATPVDFKQFVIIDVRHKRSKAVFNAPTGVVTSIGALEAHAGIDAKVLWAADKKHVVLVNTALPLTPQNPERKHMAYIVGYNSGTGKWMVIEPLQKIDANGVRQTITQVGWIKPGSELFVGHALGGKPAPGMTYTLKRDRWMGRSVNATVTLPPSGNAQPPLLSGGLSVKLHEGENEAPVMVASEGSRQISLTGPDPALNKARYIRAKPFQWRQSNGKMMVGGLLLPQDHTRPVPLVIQGYEYDQKLFMPDGPARYVYAAQSLATRGIAVLNINIAAEDRRLPNTQELPEYEDRVNSAIEALANRGLIDPYRVGIVGFSRGGFETSYVVAHPGKFPLAAAVMDDAFQGTYSCYLTLQAVGSGAVTSGYESIYGGNFWENTSGWLKDENTFNANRIETPSLMTVHDSSKLGEYLPTIGAFSLNLRPLEFLVYPDATHGLYMPRQRLASIEMTTDWMAYWLLGEEPPNPDTAVRWGNMRRQQQALLNELKAAGKDVAPLPPLKVAPAWAIARPGM